MRLHKRGQFSLVLLLLGVLSVTFLSCLGLGKNDNEGPPSGTALLALYGPVPNPDGPSNGEGSLIALNLQNGDTNSFSFTFDAFQYPLWVVKDPDSSRVFVVDRFERSTPRTSLYEIDLTSGLPVPTPDIMETFPAITSQISRNAVVRNDVLYSMDDQNIFFSWNGSSPISTVSVPDVDFFWDIEANKEGTRFYLTDIGNDQGPRGRGGVIVLDNGGAVVDTFFYDNHPEVASTSSGGQILALSPAGDKLFVAQADTDMAETTDDLIILDVNPDPAATGTILTYNKRVPLRDSTSGARVNIYYSTGMVVSGDGGQVWIACDAEYAIGGQSHQGAVAVYNMLSDTVHVSVLGSGVYPSELDLDKSGNYVVVTSDSYKDNTRPADDRVYIFSTRDLSLYNVVELPPGSHPVGVAVY